MKGRCRPEWIPKKPFLSAFMKGRQARLDGKPASDNPYDDKRTYRGSVTFSRAWWRSWKEGWEVISRDALPAE